VSTSCGIIPLFARLPIRGRLIEGYVYSDEEQARNPGVHKHRATDWEAASESDRLVRAVADGYGFASYHFLRNMPVKGIFGEGDGYGLGNFVQVFHPEQNVLTIYAHLDGIPKHIPFLPPEETEKGLIPWILRADGLEQLRMGQVIRQGEVLGRIGCSGLRGSIEWRHPIADALKSWDRSHLHLEFYRRLKNQWVSFDPFDISGKLQEYFDGERLRLGPNHVWLLGEEGQLTCAY